MINPDHWIIEIPGKRPPRPGETHWAIIQRAKQQWSQQLGWMMKRDRIPAAKHDDRFSIDITFARPGPISDRDNAFSACKVILDAMTRIGLIWDDSPRHIDLEARSISSKPSRIIIKRIRI